MIQIQSQSDKNSKIKKHIPKKLQNDDELLSCILKNIVSNGDPKEVKKKLIESFKEYTSKKFSKKKKEEKRKQLEHLSRGAMITFGLDNDYSLDVSVDAEYFGLALEMKRNIIKEYDCRNHFEKSLVDMIVIPYCRYLRFSAVLKGFVSCGISKEEVAYNAIMSKESDRSFKQYLTAFHTLQQIKNPQVNVNIKTDNAFVAQNQQNNSLTLKNNDQQ